ncbi:MULTISPECIES: hormogonium polysaccharide biosynthesis glycosyltransferase HpsE [unclassified Tolypothrix]|uniref:hormogonium polysaccharide biosynthesis glycosyltransferase HpsE n=1 Tax=unclassified Tolypothrix TaxID=2649714 RepID=UPI0005EABD62|nr:MULTISPECIES: hormogonium polysaccharide biosynthesis glycosyltransferase HpsE [unclassified Tolypothrix]BAY91646.1 glycosyl transferase family protein [Microchaete diplosiphon NIES-3275]EKF05239.1 glycosyltransferase, group 2 family protein [Tolypothrix sp. PCC 7601]MBE9083304.1 glycosyltransferase family 2 protein [Tolypothrix sp. LEGE 11397]UYD25664.1 glycosyltransferase family 2 protein [Tolypothrix sp. PCC 7712]UYD32095.1 glycosyltransferase family 2 protein [Tolypothrix sp. PCC 7601]
MIDFSVAICTFNGEERLPILLDKLRDCCAYSIGTSSNEENITWEIIIIDNNSKDNTAKVIQEYQEDWPTPYPIKYCFESRQGLSYARERAIQEAKGIFVGFLDDDNLPTPNWVAAAYSFGKHHPKAGAYGGRIYGDYEVTPPNNFERISPFLAIGGGKTTFCYTSSENIFLYKKMLPPGAGLVIRKQAWIENIPKNLFFQGRVNGSLVTAEDIEALTHIKKAGWEIWHNAEMEIYHRIPKQRLEKEYLLKLMRGVGLSRHYTRMLDLQIWQQPFVSLAYMVNDIRKIFLHWFKYRLVLKTDIIAACELELLIGAFLSPFYIYKKYLLNFNN